MPRKLAQYRLIMLFILLVVLVTTSGADWPQPFQAYPFQDAEKPVGLGIGFDCFTVKFEFSFDPIQPELMNTYSHVQISLRLLEKQGYQTLSFKNIPDSTELKDAIKIASVFTYMGHGSQQALLFVDGSCTVQKALNDSTLDSASPQNLDFVLLVACETAKDYETADTILEAFVEKYGVKKAIGFQKPVNVLVAQSWSDRFWKYALDSNTETEVWDAAERAYNDEFRSNPFVRWGATGIESLVGFGNEQVYLAEQGSGSVGGINIDEEFRKLWEQIRRTVEQKIIELQRYLEKELPELLEKWLEQILIKLEKILLDLLEQFLKELEKICVGPTSTLIAVMALLYTRRNKSKPPK